MSVETFQTERPTLIITRNALADNIVGRTFIGINGATAGQGARALGVVKEDTTDVLLEMAVIIEGTALVLAGQPLNAGDQVTANAAGKAVKPVAGEYINGICLNDQPTTGQLVEIALGGCTSVVGVSGLTTTTSTTTTTTTSTTTTSVSA